MMKLNGGFNLREIVFVEKCKAEYYNLGKKPNNGIVSIQRKKVPVVWISMMISILCMGFQ